MDSSDWDKLGVELLELDQWGDFAPARTEFTPTDPNSWKWRHIDCHPVNILVNAGVPLEHFQAYAPPLINALDQLTGKAGLELVVRALTRKGLTAATEKLLQLYQQETPLQDLSCLWAVGNAIYHISPHDHLEECLQICRDTRLGDSRHRLIVHLSRFKKSEMVFQTLVSLLEDESVRGPALEALRRLGDVRAIPAIERTSVRDGDAGAYETHQKMMALTKLKEKTGKS